MEFLGLIDRLRDYCTENNITLLYGSDAYVNALVDSSVYEENQLIMIADFKAKPEITGGRVTSVEYSGVISLGSKTEITNNNVTISELTESPIQKYDARLKYLSTRICQVIGELACSNELNIKSVDLRYDMNKFDLNADFVAATVTLNH